MAFLFSSNILIVLLHIGLPWMVLRARWEGDTAELISCAHAALGPGDGTRGLLSKAASEPMGVASAGPRRQPAPTGLRIRGSQPRGRRHDSERFALRPIRRGVKRPTSLACSPRLLTAIGEP